MTPERCKVCGASSPYAFSKSVLCAFDVGYYRCSACGFLQTEDPYWFGEAYQGSVCPLDIGAACRPIALSEITANLIQYHFDAAGQFLDYGGGVGLFVRLMRDKGFQFFRLDKYTVNVFAQYFDYENIPEERRTFDLVTAFELFEHLPNPIDEMVDMCRLTKNVFVGTELIPNEDLGAISNWPYLGPEHGQHVSFYTRRSLEIMADRVGRFLHSNGRDLHLFSEKRMVKLDFRNLRGRSLLYRFASGGLRRVQSVLEALLESRPRGAPPTSRDEQIVRERFIQEKRCAATVDE